MSFLGKSNSDKLTYIPSLHLCVYYCCLHSYTIIIMIYFYVLFITNPMICNIVEIDTITH